MAAAGATILQIVPRLDAGGAERSAVEIAEAIVAAGGTALVASEGGRLAERIVAAGGEIVPMRLDTKNPLRIVANAWRLARLVRMRNVSLVHARSRAPAWSGLMAARMTGRPFVTTYHGAYGETNAVKRLYNSVMARGDVVIANSQFTADLIMGRYGTPRGRIAVIPRGVDIARFAPENVAPERIATLRASWGVGPAQPVVLLAARLTSWKGQAVLIDAAARLRDQGTLRDAVVVLAGDPQGREGYVDRLRAQIAMCDLQDAVRIVGHVEDIAAAYATAAVSVVASTEPEAFGRVAAEALALGCPVVATRLGAPPEIVETGQGGPATGWLVPPGDPAALAAALDEALALAPDRRAEMAAAAVGSVRRRYTTVAMQSATLAVYDRLTRSRMAGVSLDG